MKKLLLTLAVGLLLAPPNALAQDYYRGTGPFTMNVTGNGVTSIAGITLQNSTLATGGATVQMGPFYKSCGNAWDTAASETVCFFTEVLPATAATPTGTWRVGYSLNGAAATYPFTLNSVGTGTFLGNVNVGSILGLGGASQVNWAGTLQLVPFGAGQLNISNAAVTAGVGFDVTTDGTLKIRTRAQNADAAITALSAAIGSHGTLLSDNGANSQLITTSGNLVIAPQSGQLSFSPGNTLISVNGTFNTYNTRTTAGVGVSAIYGENISGTQTSNFTALSYTPPATAGRYEVSAVITTTSSTNTGTVQVTVDYVDSQGTVHTGDIMALMDAAGVIATTKTGASKEFHTLPWKITINNAATAIVIKVVITGSVSYTVSPLIEQKG